MDHQSKIAWDPYTPGYFENPYIHLSACRNENPVHRVLGNSWIFLKYKDVSEILSSEKFHVTELSKFFEEKEPMIFKDSGQCPFLSKGTSRWPMYLNGDLHKRTRAAMLKSFNLKGLESDLPEFVSLVNRQYQSHRSLDLVNYCAQYVFLVVKKILGIQHEDLTYIKQYSNWLARSQDLYMPKQLYQEVNGWLLSGKGLFAGSTFEKQLKDYARQSDSAPSEDDIYSMCALALMAAFETSKDNLAAALLTLMRQPQLLEYVENCNSDELDLLIEELFRYTSPLQYTVRVNKEDIEYHASRIPARSKLYLCLASANRDDTIFEMPDQILVNRTPNPHLSFGKGLHFCIGAGVARLEMVHCLKPMVRFLRDYRIDDGEGVRWSRQIMMRTVESIAITKGRG